MKHKLNKHIAVTVALIVTIVFFSGLISYIWGVPGDFTVGL